MQIWSLAVLGIVGGFAFFFGDGVAFRGPFAEVDQLALLAAEGAIDLFFRPGNDLLTRGAINLFDATHAQVPRSGLQVRPRVEGGWPEGRYCRSRRRRVPIVPRAAVVAP